ncbi:hypothetical protein ES332_A06G082600v1 [Gossypium tomentosum]|uniref:Uncharacterized protein n=1 Tax=Gossypium tomentosum TaxID=34277 RepID=A0A5D2Q3G9_GOSTO|nr:hypothetical protein ES332_A06G082600v1 [Gossypium tomentosum]
MLYNCCFLDLPFFKKKKTSPYTKSYIGFYSQYLQPILHVFKYVRECIIDVTWWSSARRRGSARLAVPGDCPGLWRLMVLAARLLFLLLLFFFGLLGFAWGLGN